MTTSEQPQQKAESTSDASGSSVAAALLVIQKLGPSFYAAAVGALYVCGFIVLNSHLVRFGVADVEFVDARYFLAGASFLFFLVCFYIFGGRAVLFTPKWLAEDLKQTNKAGPKPFWSFVVFLDSMVTGTFFCCLSAALFTSLSISISESAIFYATIAGAFFLLYTVDITNFDLKFPRVAKTITIFTKVISIIAFFSGAASDGPMLTVFLIYIAFFFFINLVLDTLTRYRITVDRVSVTAINVMVFILSGSIAFGALLYGQVSSKLGGALPASVSVGLTDDARSALPASFAETNSRVLDGKLIHQTESYTYVVSSGQTIRFRTHDVVVMVLRDKPKIEPAAPKKASVPPNNALKPTR